MASTKLYHEYLQFMSMNEATSVLETGSGPGNGISIIQNSISPSCSFIATDISPGFLKELKKIRARNFSAQEANIEELPFPEEFFDRYISNMAIHNASDPEKAFKEAYRVLQNGGILGVSTFGSNDETNTYMALMKKFRKFINQPYHESILSNLSIMGSPENFKKFVRKIGFRRVIGYSAMAVYPFTTPEEAADLFLSFGPLDQFMKNNPDQAGELENLVMSQLYECLVTNGTPIGYESTILIALK
mmetsp:Transcript_22081/g.21785  ORF Transcript_22081/g.21785 Transcript_22081/m.21785 type:complete len:246 (+) Transcript_22081:153-890(+)|eukprot:CAMPEP_0202948004 /NCGR_PEP_ID=MMETSP1395-20130829/12930_1 /ASSEMBLY_ACC=CAM_ASM_000871 /TAXON_ID=5961 /ORGANISM="Blepharisma japonicum, Strain Stock R1072" /LENGTH=245 /DNA_ID=CAMNT_0049649693 /DNA_START=145 /DNA_END=882 /DNA_ORIENTATION=+